MTRRVVGFVVILSAALAAGASPVSAAPPVGTCPPTFELLTFDPSLSTPIDKNGNHAICVQTLENNPQFGVNLIDDTAQVP
jgi:hypothetical protein